MVPGEISPETAGYFLDSPLTHSCVHLSEPEYKLKPNKREIGSQLLRVQRFPAVPGEISPGTIEGDFCRYGTVAKLKFESCAQDN